MALDERVKYERLVRFLLLGDIQNILRHSLGKDELVILGMKLSAFSGVPAGKRKYVLRGALDNLDSNPNKPSILTVPGISSLDSLINLLGEEIYLQESVPTSFGKKDRGGEILITRPVPQTSNNYGQLIHRAIKLLDQVNVKYITEVEENNSMALRNRLINEKDQLTASGEIHRWIYALVTSELMSKNIVAAQLSEFMSKENPQGISVKGEEYILLIQAFSSELDEVERERAKLAEQISDLERQDKDKTRTIEELGSERDQLRRNYERLEKQYRTLEETTGALQAQITELGSRPQGDNKELTERIKALEAERDDYRRQADENIALSESYLADMTRQREAHGLAERKLQARIQGLTRLLEKYQGNGTDPHEETMEEIFVGAGLDYDLINAIVVGGSQNLTRVGGTSLTAVNWRKNTLGELRDKSKIDQFESAVDMLVSQGILLSIDRDVLSVSRSPENVANPTLKMYLADVLKDPTKYRN